MSVLCTHVQSVSLSDDGPSDQSVIPASQWESSTNNNSQRTTQWMTVAQHSLTCRACTEHDRHHFHSHWSIASSTFSSTLPPASPKGDDSASIGQNNNIHLTSSVIIYYLLLLNVTLCCIMRRLIFSLSSPNIVALADSHLWKLNNRCMTLSQHAFNSLTCLLVRYKAGIALYMRTERL